MTDQEFADILALDRKSPEIEFKGPGSLSERRLAAWVVRAVLLLAMLLIGGSSIRELLLVVAIGVIVGTYSSIFVASQFVVIWERGEFGRIIGRGRRSATTAATGLLSMLGLLGR